ADLLQSYRPSLPQVGEIRLAGGPFWAWEQVLGSGRLFDLAEKRIPGIGGHRHISDSVHCLGIRDMDDPILQIDLLFLHRKELLFVTKPRLRNDHHDIAKIIWSREFDFRLLARRHVVRLASRLRDRYRELDGPAWVVR